MSKKQAYEVLNHGMPRHYEDKKITHMVKHRGEIMVLESVAAKVCSVCGDVLLPISSVEKIEEMLANPGTRKDCFSLHGPDLATAS